jgi:hypothetical protein
MNKVKISSWNIEKLPSTSERAFFRVIVTFVDGYSSSQEFSIQAPFDANEDHHLFLANLKIVGILWDEITKRQL